MKKKEKTKTSWIKRLIKPNKEKRKEKDNSDDEWEDMEIGMFDDDQPSIEYRINSDGHSNAVAFSYNKQN